MGPDPYQFERLTKELIAVLLAVRAKIHNNSDCVWSYYESPQQAQNEIDQYISDLGKGNIDSLTEISVHFAPTSAYQELSLQNGWSDEYLNLAEKFDNIHAMLKSCS